VARFNSTNTLSATSRVFRYLITSHTTYISCKSYHKSTYHGSRNPPSTLWHSTLRVHLQPFQSLEVTQILTSAIRASAIHTSRPAQHSGIPNDDVVQHSVRRSLLLPVVRRAIHQHVSVRRDAGVWRDVVAVLVLHAAAAVRGGAARRDCARLVSPPRRGALWPRQAQQRGCVGAAHREAHARVWLGSHQGWCVGAEARWSGSAGCDAVRWKLETVNP